MDGQILIWIQEHLRAGWLNPIMRAITSLGNAGLFWILLALVLLSFKKTRKIGLACAVSIAIGALITNLILKNWIARIRPYEALESLSILVSKPHDFSFPSGHSTASFAGRMGAVSEYEIQMAHSGAGSRRADRAFAPLCRRPLSDRRARRLRNRNPLRRDFDKNRTQIHQNNEK